MKRIVGLFNKEVNALKAIERLRADGYRDEEISVITMDKESYDRLSRVLGDDIMSDSDIKSVNATEKAASGSVIGGIGGFILGLGALAIPGAGPVLAAGPIAGAITGAIAGGVVGGVASLLTEYGIPEEEAKTYEERISEGDIMILVDDDEERREAVYDNFYENESYTRDGYRKGDPGLNLDEDKVDPNDPLNDPKRLL